MWDYLISNWTAMVEFPSSGICLLNLLFSTDLKIWDKNCKDGLSIFLKYQQFLQKKRRWLTSLALSTIFKALHKPQLTLPECPFCHCRGNIHWLCPREQKAVKLSHFWAPFKSLTITQSTQKGWTDKERWIQASLRMLLKKTSCLKPPLTFMDKGGQPR